MFQQFYFIYVSPRFKELSQLIRTYQKPFFSFLRHAFMVSGIAAITAVTIICINPDIGIVKTVSPLFSQSALSDDVQPVSQSTTTLTTDADKTTQGEAAVPDSVRQQQSVTKWLSKRYRVANDAAHMIVSASYLTAKEFKLDPLLILSVMAIESGLNPFAESPVGAQGLMQVMSHIHRDKFSDLGGVKEALNPKANIRVGAQILKEYVTRTGSVEGGLKLYVGAALAENDGGYGSRVLAEYRFLKDVSNGKSVPVNASAKSKTATPMRANKPLATPIDKNQKESKDPLDSMTLAEI